MYEWHSRNYTHTTPDVNQPFSITCPNQTDLYDKPPNTHRSDAPHIYTTTTVGAFKRAAVTVYGTNFVYQYDQGGLCMMIRPQNSDAKWIKAGMEKVEGQTRVSVVVKDNWADWSLSPLIERDVPNTRIQLEVEDDGALWAYVIGNDGAKIPIREVTWWAALDSNTPIEIGPAAAKPSEEGGDLIVNFDDFVLELV